MVEDRKAVGKNISLYPKQIDAVERFSSFKNFKYEAEAYQYIIEDFFKHDDKLAKYDFILYLVVPIIFCVLTTITNLSTDKVFNILLEQGLFFDELYLLSRVFMILSFGSIGILIACVYWYRVKLIRHGKGG